MTMADPIAQALETAPATPAGRQAAYSVDINRAEWPELAQIPQVGETLARRIVDVPAGAGHSSITKTSAACAASDPIRSRR